MNEAGLYDTTDVETFAADAHRGQMYGDRPYVEHLRDVAEEMKGMLRGMLAGRGISESVAVAAAWLHDAVENMKVTVEDIAEAFGDSVSYLVWAVTDEPGKNRAERKAKTYKKIREFGVLAVALKLADRLANVRASKEGNRKLFEMYMAEQPAFRAALYDARDEIDRAWELLEEFFKFPTIKLVMHTGEKAGRDAPDPERPFMFACRMRPVDFAFVLIHGGSEDVVARAATAEELERWADYNRLLDGPRVSRAQITRPESADPFAPVKRWGRWRDGQREF